LRLNQRQKTVNTLIFPSRLLRTYATKSRLAHFREAIFIMPLPDQAVLARRAEIVAALRAIVPGEGVIDSAAEMLPYESDGLTAYRQPPMVVVLPDTTEQVSQVLRHCRSSWSLCSE
jgi:hypothetical protein